MNAETILLIVLAWLCFGFPLAVLVGKAMAHGNKPIETHGRPLLGELEADRIEREARADRARFRHSTRYSRRDVA